MSFDRHVPHRSPHDQPVTALAPERKIIGYRQGWIDVWTDGLPALDGTVTKHRRHVMGTIPIYEDEQPDTTPQV